jgi:hypothetical protein
LKEQEIDGNLENDLSQRSSDDVKWMEAAQDHEDDRLMGYSAV